MRGGTDYNWERKGPVGNPDGKTRDSAATRQLLHHLLISSIDQIVVLQSVSWYSIPTEPANPSVE
jgi:hypothetical protein